MSQLFQSRLTAKTSSREVAAECGSPQHQDSSNNWHGIWHGLFYVSHTIFISFTDFGLEQINDFKNSVPANKKAGHTIDSISAVSTGSLCPQILVSTQAKLTTDCIFLQVG